MIYRQIFEMNKSELFSSFNFEVIHSALSKSVLFTSDSEEMIIVSVSDTVH